MADSSRSAGGHAVGFGQQGAQVEGGGDQHPGPGHGGEGGGDVGRVEGPAAVEGAAGLQHQQHGGFETVHVLRRHGADDGGGLAAKSTGQVAGLGLGVAYQVAPVLGVGYRGASGAGGEHVGDAAAVGDARYRQVGQGVCLGGPGHVGRGLRIAAGGQVDGAVGLVGEAEHVRGEVAHAPHRLRRVGGRQQADPVADDGRRQGHGEAVAVGAGVEDVAASGHGGGHPGHVGEEFPDRNGAQDARGSFPVGDGGSGGGVGDERRGIHDDRAGGGPRSGVGAARPVRPPRGRSAGRRVRRRGCCLRGASRAS